MEKVVLFNFAPKGSHMISKMKFIILYTIFSLTIAGCISPKSFVDPTYPKVSYDEVKRKETPLRLILLTEFQRNGEHLTKVDSILRDNTERVLRTSGVITPVVSDGEGQIKVIVNNVGDKGAAAAKGFGTGLTFGLVGTSVTDAYEMTVSITVNGKTVERTAIKHALHTAIGNTSVPDGMETMPINAAFERVLEQMILRVLRDMQATGELSHYPIFLPRHPSKIQSRTNSLDRIDPVAFSGGTGESI